LSAVVSTPTLEDCNSNTNKVKSNHCLL
jgi:hypothetical protein